MLDMASVDIAGCEFDTSKEADVTPAFATDNFFPLLGVPNGDAGNVTLGQIKMLQSKITDSINMERKKRIQHDPTSFLKSFLNIRMVNQM